MTQRQFARFAAMLGAMLLPTGVALAQIAAPDAAPSTPVDMVVMENFEPTREEAKLEAFVDGVVGAHMREHLAPAVTVSVVKNGRIVFAKGYGVADEAAGRRADGAETLFRIGSVS